MAIDDLARVTSIADAATEFDLLRWRYIYVDDPQDRQLVEASLVGAMNRNRSMPSFRWTANGHLLQIDGAQFCSTLETFDNWRNTWERLARNPDREPYFLSNQTVDLTNVRVGSLPTVVDGKTWHHLKKSKTTWRVIGPHVGQSGEQLQFALGTQVPIVRWAWLNRRINSSVEEDGGLYYRFRGFPKAKKNDKSTDFDLFLKHVRCDVKTIREAGADSKWVTPFSDVTGRPRTVYIARTFLARPIANNSLAFMTFDPREETFHFDVEFDPFRTVPEVKLNAIEVFVQRSDGMLETALFDGSGRFDSGSDLQAEAPSSVVTDHSMSVNHPHPARLVAPVSCYRCHSDESGFKMLGPSAGADLTREPTLQMLLRSGGYTYIPRDAGKITPGFRDRVQSLFGVDLDKYAFARLIWDARGDLDMAYSVLSGRDMDARAAWSGIARSYDAYWFDRVTPQDACRDLGYNFDDDRDKAVSFLRDNLGATVPEDPIFAILLSGGDLHRTWWQTIFVDAATRVLLSQEAQRDAAENHRNSVARPPVPGR